MFTFEVKDNHGLVVDAIRKTGTAAQHYTWCVGQAVTLLNLRQPGRAIETFVGGMQERDDTNFYIKYRWPWKYDNKVLWVVNCITCRAADVAGVQNCLINSVPDVTEEQIEEQRPWCTIS